jgi:hypothetical protein
MNNPNKSENMQPVSRTITHKDRKKSSDVNPLQQSSSQPIVSLDDNFVVGRQKSGQLHNIDRNFKLTLRDKLLNGIEKYYEVDKRSYPFEIKFYGLASKKATQTFDVTLEFSLQVSNPCMIVEGNHTSLLNCVELDLKHFVSHIARCYDVENTEGARYALQQKFEKRVVESDGLQQKFENTELEINEPELLKQFSPFTCPDFLEMKFRIASIMPDEASLKKLRELQDQSMDRHLIDKNTEIETRVAAGKKFTAVAVDSIEDIDIKRQIEGQKLKLIGVLPSNPAE